MLEILISFFKKKKYIYKIKWSNLDLLSADLPRNHVHPDDLPRNHVHPDDLDRVHPDDLQQTVLPVTNSVGPIFHIKEASTNNLLPTISINTEVEKKQ